MAAKTAPEPKKLSLPEVCVRVGRRDRMVRYWITDGLKGHRLPAFKVGREVFVTEPALNQFLAATGRMHAAC